MIILRKHWNKHKTVINWIRFNQIYWIAFNLLSNFELKTIFSINFTFLQLNKKQRTVLIPHQIKLKSPRYFVVFLLLLKCSTFSATFFHKLYFQHYCFWRKHILQYTKTILGFISTNFFRFSQLCIINSNHFIIIIIIKKFKK